MKLLPPKDRASFPLGFIFASASCLGITSWTTLIKFLSEVVGIHTVNPRGCPLEVKTFHGRNFFFLRPLLSSKQANFYALSLTLTLKSHSLLLEASLSGLALLGFGRNPQGEIQPWSFYFRIPTLTFCCFFFFIELFRVSILPLCWKWNCSVFVTHSSFGFQFIMIVVSFCAHSSPFRHGCTLKACRSMKTCSFFF